MEMVLEYQKSYKNISYFRNDTAVGMLPAILESIDMSNGTYTWLMGSDDFMQKDSLSIVLGIIKEKSPTVILSNRLMVDGAGETDEYGETEKKTRFFHGFSDFSVYLGLKEDQKYQDKWNYMTFMSVFCFQTSHYQEML
jgi:Glycosyl transferase family 2